MTDAMRLARRLQRYSKRALVLQLRDCPASYLIVHRSKREIRATVHPAFVHAPRFVIAALGAYLEYNTQGDVLDLFFRSWEEDQGCRQTRHVHDLLTIVYRLGRQYRLARRSGLSIIWNRRATVRENEHPRLASFRAESGMIVVNRLLDRPTVPRFVLEWVVFHELLHAVHRVRSHNGHRVFHPPAFRRDERRFRNREQARTWVRRHLSQIFPF